MRLKSDTVEVGVLSQNEIETSPCVIKLNIETNPQGLQFSIFVRDSFNSWLQSIDKRADC